MIGDLVYYEGKPLRILGIDNYSSCNVILDMGKRWYDEETVDERAIEPIPLTEEILKVNGWKKNDPNWPSTLRMSYKKEEHSFTLSCWMQKGKWDMYIHASGDMELNRFHPSYVHELQHALRMIGLNELADNFKV